VAGAQRPLNQRINAMPYMNGYQHPFSYDPFLMFMMMNQQKREEDLKDEDVIRRYEALKKAFEPPKKEEKKEDKKDKWETADYFLAIILMFSILIPVTAYIFISQIIQLVNAIHR
jgi:hypothetical protein